MLSDKGPSLNLNLRNLENKLKKIFKLHYHWEEIEWYCL